MSVMWDEIASSIMQNINNEDNVFSVGRVVNVSKNMIDMFQGSIRKSN